MLTKVGCHVLQPTDPALAWLRTANIVKVVDRADLLRQCRPDAVTIYRKYFPVQDLSRHGADVAREVIDDCRQAGVVPTFVELYNEVGQHEGDRLLQLAAEAMPVAREYGSEVLALSGGTGWWEREDWERWAVRDFYGVRHLALHAYWGNEGFSEWNACRYLKALEWTGRTDLRFWLTEVGRDAVEGGLGGWQRDGLTADQYRAEVQQYDDVVGTCQQVGGGVLFSAGAPEGTWQPFNSDPLWPLETEPRRLWPVAQATGGSETKLAIAWIPSNQDGNRGALPGHNEAGNCRILALAANEKAVKAGVLSHYFAPALESGDLTQYASLRKTFADARVWLDEQVKKGYKTAAVHVHTNAAKRPEDGTSHTGYCYSQRVPESQGLGKAIADKLAAVLGLPVVPYDYTDWLFDVLLRPHPSTIIEVTRHDRRADLENLYAKSELVSDSLVSGVMAWAGSTTPAATTNELEQLRDALAREKAKTQALGDLAQQMLTLARAG